VNWKKVSTTVRPLSLQCLPASTLLANTRTTTNSVIRDGLDRQTESTDRSSQEHFTFKDSAAQSGAEVLA
jgi:hypothetical protein